VNLRPYLLLLVLSFGLMSTTAGGARAELAGNLSDHIDPFIGTGGHGHTFPGPVLPFGMVQLSPDTRLTGWDGCSGYHHSDTVVFGFSHTHLSGTGVGDYGDILLMPVTGRPLLENGYPDRPDEGYGSRFRKSEERAAAGYYRTFLDDYGIEVELTATERTGLHRYEFPPDRPGHVIIDLEHRDKLLDVGLQVIDERTVAGFRRSEGWARDQLVHFRAVFSRPFTVTELVPGPGELDGRTGKAVLSFGAGGGELLVQVAISAVDDDGARRNLEAEWVEFDFAGTRRAARKAWSRELAPFEVTGAGSDQLTVLASALYHSFIAPNLFSDVDGRFRGLDLGVHRSLDRKQYTVFSLWDTYRATHPLFTLVQRERTADFVNTALNHYTLGGRLPVWELAANETDCMIGYHSVSFIADAWLKGIRGFDPELALRGMIDSAGRDHFGLDAYRRDGYISLDFEHESVSKTLEYAYDDACIARFARALGHEEVAAEFGRRAQSWRHLFDPESRCFRPRRNGQWLTPYDPRQVDFNHTEANGWQYRFAAPQHMPQHLELLGGDTGLSAVLDSLFTLDSATTGRDQPDITGRMGQYAHGNEPSHHMAWLYHFTGQPELSRQRVGRILREFYTDRPDGLIGNEDCGQMSSWYVLAAYGLYDVAPTSGQWVIIPPLHPRMSMLFEDGKVFTTRRQGSGEVRRVLWNGQELRRSWLSHAEITSGGELVFELGEAGAWGRDEDHRPGTELEVPAILPAPWAAAAADRFRGRQAVSLHALDPRATIFWTLDPGGDPLQGSPYEGPITLDRTCDLRFVALLGAEVSPVVTARFNAIPNDWKLEITSTPNPQYTAGGADALIDGRRGPENWRTGSWQGYEGQDFVAVLDLGEARPLQAVGASFLQDMRSWIFMPRELVVEVSADGRNWRPAGSVGHEVPDREEGIFLADLVAPLDGSPVRAIRFQAVNYGPMPEWHLGAGGQGFIFVDELIVR
jgi:predicted alpha-1,2-mannosidase